MAVKMSSHKAVRTVAAYVCANCWGKLKYEPIEDWKAIVSCKTEGCPCKGFVSKYHIDHAERQGKHEKLKAERDLRGRVPWLPAGEKKTADEIIKELGF